jgi:plasmid stabilization system protein ParE
MAKLNWTNEAEVWLKDIYSYIAVDSPNAAVKVINGIYQKAQLLLDYPEIGYQYNAAIDGNIRILL